MLSINSNGSILKVNLDKCLVVDAAAITHKNAVNIYPGVIIALELKNHVIVLSCRTEDLAILRH